MRWIWHRDVTRPTASRHPFALSTKWDILFLSISHMVLLLYQRLHQNTECAYYDSYSSMTGFTEYCMLQPIDYSPQ